MTEQKEYNIEEMIFNEAKTCTERRRYELARMRGYEFGSSAKSPVPLADKAIEELIASTEHPESIITLEFDLGYLEGFREFEKTPKGKEFIDADIVVEDITRRLIFDAIAKTTEKCRYYDKAEELGYNAGKAGRTNMAVFDADLFVLLSENDNGFNSQMYYCWDNGYFKALREKGVEPEEFEL